MKHIFSIFIVLIMFSVQARPIVTPTVNDTTKVSNHNVDYQIIQDQTHVFLQLNTTDSETILSLLHTGITVYFDTKGKKKENVSIKYPLLTPGTPFKMNKSKDLNIESIESETALKNRIVTILENDFPKEAEYTHFDASEKFHVLMNSLDINLSITYDKEKGEFIYKLKIPKHKISSESKIGLSKLTIGVQSTKRIKQEKGENGPGFNAGRPRAGGQQVGQGRGGQNSGPPGRQGGPPNNNRKQKITENQLNFWFEAKL